MGQRRTIAIIGSLYNDELVAPLIESTNSELLRLAPGVSVPVYRVPGAFEIPVCAKYILEQSPIDCVIALGVIIRGETAHADLVGSSVTNALQNIAVDKKTPVIHEVLLVDNKQQAAARCAGEKNRGIEAARAAVTMTDLFAKMKSATADTGQRKPVGSNG
jgi:6,7-dimethyl-8-ribityllumazine synthase